MYEVNDDAFNFSTPWWDGTFKLRRMPPDVFVYYIEVEFPNSKIRIYEGEITLVR